ncbi:MAG TPA: DUF2779 domain-containing protein, partial [Bacteroidia bacterium]|nr:DUF2779 domain-containing protein [Bacteroidia bacterium]
ISIIYINNQYTRKNDLELNKLFIIESVKNKVIQLQESIEQKINELKSVLTSGTAPHEDIGLQCSDPYPCDYSSHCWKHIKEPSVFDLVRLNSNKKFQLYKKGIIEFTQLPHDYNLTDGQRMQVDCFLNQKTFIDKSAIKAFLSELSFPLFYLDFESFQSFIPLFNNSKPYQQIAFQYSLHKKSKRDEEPIHYDFLADADGNDPRITFIESLLNDTESTGQIMVYNQAFEITILKQLASDFPKYAEDIHERISRIVDLMIPFSKHMYYNPRQNGRHSLKVVLPAVVSGLSYDNLEIGQGADASAAFLSLYNNRNKSDVEKIRINLKEYCRMDTYAMVKLFEFLEKI